MNWTFFLRCHHFVTLRALFLNELYDNDTVRGQFVMIMIIIIIIIIGLTHSKTILENSLKIKPQPAALDFENLF